MILSVIGHNFESAGYSHETERLFGGLAWWLGANAFDAGKEKPWASIVILKPGSTIRSLTTKLMCRPPRERDSTGQSAPLEK